MFACVQSSPSCIICCVSATSIKADLLNTLFFCSRQIDQATNITEESKCPAKCLRLLLLYKTKKKGSLPQNTAYPVQQGNDYNH
uniref:IDP1468 n=1 Tax=Arundo donax TaxID=35708 RepID=A0A0A9CWA7_ARUDO